MTYPHYTVNYRGTSLTISELVLIYVRPEGHERGHSNIITLYTYSHVVP